LRWAAHTGIAEEGSAFWENLFVGGLRMGVSADHRAYPAIKKPAHCDFLARRFRVHVDEDDRSFHPKTRDFLVHDKKRILQRRIHERPPLRVHHCDLNPGTMRELQDNRSVAGRAGRIVDRAQEARLGVEVRNDLALVPNMIATRDHSDAATKKIDADLR